MQPNWNQFLYFILASLFAVIIILMLGNAVRTAEYVNTPLGVCGEERDVKLELSDYTLAVTTWDIDNNPVEVYTNDEDWHMVLTFESGISCIIAVGRDWPVD